MEGLSGDLQVKYQKIAAEYSKLRAQASVLKKAVVDEQSRNVELRDVLREREQSLRKSTQEMDSLTFRNQQLTKRVTVLQEELDASEARPKKGKIKPADNNHHGILDSTNVVDEELQKKIEENVRLVTMIQENDSAHKQEVAALTERVEFLEHELKKYCMATDETEQKFKAVISKLETEKSLLSRGAGDQDSALDECTTELNRLRQEHFHLKNKIGSQLETATEIITRHLPFVDTSEQALNELNVPRHERKQQLYSLHVISQAGNHVKELAAALSDYHTYTEQRMHCLQSTISPVNNKFSIYLKENARYLRGIEVGYSELQDGLESADNLLTLQTLPALQTFSSKLTSYTNYLHKLLPYLQLSLEEECTGMSNEVRFVASNQEVAFQVKSITDQFIKLNSYVKLLSVQSKRSSQHPATSQHRFLVELVDVLKTLAEAMKDLSRAHVVKSNLQLDVPEPSEILRTTDECLIKSVDAMTAATLKLSTVLSDSQLELWKSSSTATQQTASNVGNTHPIVATFKKRASQYLSSLDTEESPSVPYYEALRDRDQVRNSVTNCEQLNQQLANCRDKATKLKQEKEHWHLEYQLLQLKFSKRVKELDDKLEDLQGSVVLTGKDETCPDVLVGPTMITNLIGRLDAPFMLTAEMEAREQEVKNYLTSRIDQLVASYQEKETKATTLSMECGVLEKRLELCTASKMQGDCRLQEAHDRIVRLQEELHTTTHNYETQLSIISEHLANMNDKLIVQRDEIDQLKYQLTNKSSRKGKQK